MVRGHGDGLSLVGARARRVGLGTHPRLAFYTPAHRLSLTAGPLRLLDGGFPHREAMRAIAEHNLRRVLDHEDVTNLH